MSHNIVKLLQRAAVASVLAATVAACSTPGEQTASASGQIRSWADWSSSAPAEQTAAAPNSSEIRSWGDWSSAQQ